MQEGFETILKAYKCVIENVSGHFNNSLKWKFRQNCVYPLTSRTFFLENHDKKE